MRRRQASTITFKLSLEKFCRKINVKNILLVIKQMRTSYCKSSEQSVAKDLVVNSFIVTAQPCKFLYFRHCHTIEVFQNIVFFCNSAILNLMHYIRREMLFLYLMFSIVVLHGQFDTSKLCKKYLQLDYCHVFVYIRNFYTYIFKINLNNIFLKLHLKYPFNIRIPILSLIP